MITNIEEKITIKNNCKKLNEKIMLVSKYGYLFSDIFKTLDNKVIDLNENRVILNGTNITYDKDNKIILDKCFDGTCNVYNSEGNILFSGKNVSILNDKLFSQGYNLNKKVLCDDKGNIISKKSYNALISYSCDRIITIKDKKYGVIDSKGNIIIKPKYSYISKYNNGIAIVKDYDGYMLIDTYGNVITKDKYDCISLYDDIYKVEKNKKSGILDSKGNEFIPVCYDYIGFFSDDLAIVEINNKYGFINKHNELVINAIYDDVSCFCNGFARVNKDDQIYIIDKKGNVVFESYDELANISGPNDGLYIATKIIDDYTTKLGYINELGNTIIPFMYDDAYPFKNDLAVVKLNDKCGVIDKNNNLIIDFKYDYITPFFNNYAVTRNNNFKNYGLINNLGETILPSVFNHIILLNNNCVYVDGYIYDINNIELDYKIIIQDDERFILKSFENAKEMNDYYNLFMNEYNKFVNKLELQDNKKLIKNK